MIMNRLIRVGRRRRLKIFIADASLSGRRLLQGLVTAQPGARLVGSASCASKACEMILETKPNVIFLSPALPGTNGLEVLLLIKNQLRSAVVIMVAQRVFPRMQMKCLAAGADLFLTRSEALDRVPTILERLQRRPLIPQALVTHPIIAD